MLYNSKEDWTIAKVFGIPYSYKTYTGHEWDHRYYIDEAGYWAYTRDLPNYHHEKVKLPKVECSLQELSEAILAKLIEVQDRLESLERDRYSYD